MSRWIQIINDGVYEKSKSYLSPTHLKIRQHNSPRSNTPIPVWVFPWAIDSQWWWPVMLTPRVLKYYWGQQSEVCLCGSYLLMYTLLVIKVRHFRIFINARIIKFHGTNNIFLWKLHLKRNDCFCKLYQSGLMKGAGSSSLFLHRLAAGVSYQVTVGSDRAECFTSLLRWLCIGLWQCIETWTEVVPVSEQCR